MARRFMEGQLSPAESDAMLTYVVDSIAFLAVATIIEAKAVYGL